MWTLLSAFLCVSTIAAEEVCATCESPPVQSAALLQSSVQRHAKHAGAPHMFSPAQMFGPGAKGRQMQSMARMGHGPRMGPHMGPHANMPPYNFEQRHTSVKQAREESLYDGAELTPCQAPVSFLPDKEMYGWCDTWTLPVQPDEATCAAADGCRYSWGYCYCETEAGCNAIAGTWNGFTCKSEFENMWPEYFEKVKEAHMAGTCEGKEVYGWGVKDMVAWPASQCCTDYPNTMCEHNVQAMAPCKDQADFRPDAYAYAWCDLWSVEPSKETCDATPDCKEDWGYCNCKTKTSCELLGGYFSGTTCQQEVGYWYPGIHKAVKEASEKGTCQGVQGPWGDIKYSVDMVGFACCGSGKSICEELDNYDAGYSQFY